MEASVQDPVRLVVPAIGGLWWLWLAFGIFWFGLIYGIAMVILGFWTAGQFFIERAYVLLVFAGIWALFHGVGGIIKAFQIRRVAKLLEEAL